MVKVSIIVAFYNIKDCVRYCVNSLLNQSYLDYEVVLVDDGSTDATSSLLDEYKNNPKVIVLHKKNGGLSDARNYGVKHSSGQYITFVDGDDFVSPYYLESLIKAMDNCDDRMVIGSPLIVRMNEALVKKNIEWHYSNCEKVLSYNEALELVLYENIKTSACGKLAPRELYERINFPVDKYYEEIATIGFFLGELNSFVLLNEAIYAYVMRPGSIVNRKTAKFKQVDDYLDAIEGLKRSIKTSYNYPSITEAVIFHESLQLSRIFRLLNTVEGNQERIAETKDYIRKSIKINLNTLIFSKKISFGNKARFVLLAFFPKLFNFSFKIYEKVKKGI